MLFISLANFYLIFFIYFITIITYLEKDLMFIYNV